jgi:hypothetical protein
VNHQEPIARVIGRSSLGRQAVQRLARRADTDLVEAVLRNAADHVEGNIVLSIDRDHAPPAAPTRPNAGATNDGLLGDGDEAPDAPS